jgi:hypothetical protein
VTVGYKDSAITLKSTRGSFGWILAHSSILVGQEMGHAMIAVAASTDDECNISAHAFSRVVS